MTTSVCIKLATTNSTKKLAVFYRSPKRDEAGEIVPGEFVETPFGNGDGTFGVYQNGAELFPSFSDSCEVVLREVPRDA